jgi:hypothetical protein
VVIAIEENATATGYVTVEVRDETGRLVSEQTFKNRLTNHAVACAARLWVDQYVKTPSRIRLGTGSPPSPQTKPLATDTSCWTPANDTLKSVDVKATFLTTYSEFIVSYGQNEANDLQYTEATLEDEDGNVWAHAIISAAKTSGQTMAVIWKVRHEGN